MGGWTGSDDAQSVRSQEAVDRGVTFFDTAWGYGEGHSERLLGALMADNPDKKLYAAAKLRPRNGQFPATADQSLEDAYPENYVRESVYRSLENLRTDRIDLMQFHTWDDAWTEDNRWKGVVRDLKDEGVVGAWGISLNRWEPWNGIHALETSLFDAVQVTYNLFDQNPEDEPFPVCEAHNIAVITRMPFGEGSLTGKLAQSSSWPEGDWRNRYFGPENFLQPWSASKNSERLCLKG